jgi:hypothetical protein
MFIQETFYIEILNQTISLWEEENAVINFI